MAAPPAEPSTTEASGSAVFLSESRQERIKVSVALKKAVFEAYRAKDRAELRRCQLKESQHLISWAIHSLQHPTAGSPLHAEFLSAGPQLLPGLQADFARVNQQLAQDALASAAPTAVEPEH